MAIDYRKFYAQFDKALLKEILHSLLPGGAAMKYIPIAEDFFIPKRSINPSAEVYLDPCHFDPQLEAMCRQHDDHFWPHKGGCPICGSDAYVGLDRVECSMATCQNWYHREGM